MKADLDKLIDKLRKALQSGDQERIARYAADLSFLALVAATEFIASWDSDRCHTTEQLLKEAKRSLANSPFDGMVERELETLPRPVTK